MIFSSSIFLLVFLPAVLLLYFIVPTRPAKNVLLLVVSLLFYAWGEPVYIVLMVFSILVNWILAILIEKIPARAKLILILDLVVNLAILGFFKYEGFLASNVNFVVGFNLMPDLDLPLPIGISFYTLQAISYVIDVYRKKSGAQRNPLYFGMYIAMFSKLTAGPIVRYRTIETQILDRKENLRDFSAGVRLFCIGLAKKVLLSNIVAILATNMLTLGGQQIGVVGAWGGLIAYTFQIFFDFSGYSDMAVGLGKMFGFKYLRNFNYPYISRSVTEFWRRWHISLSSFFRDYVYFPLGGSRVKQGRRIFNLTVVWFLTGFWHGAAWNFILWGLFYLVFLLLEKYVIGDKLAKAPSIIQHVYTILVFMFGWLFFWIENLHSLKEYFIAMFGAFGLTGSSTFWELAVWSYIPVLVACAIAATPIIPWLRAKLVAWVEGTRLLDFGTMDLPNTKHLSADSMCDYEGYIDEAALPAEQHGRLVIFKLVLMGTDILLLILLVVSIVSVVSGSFSPFMYFRF